MVAGLLGEGSVGRGDPLMPPRAGRGSIPPPPRQASVPLRVLS